MGSNPLVIEGENKDYTINDEFPLREAQNEGVDFLLRKFNVLLNHQT